MPSVVTMTGPGTASVTDDTALAIKAQLVPVLTSSLNAIIAQIGNPEVPGTMLACLAEINSNLTRIADLDKSIAKSVSDLNIAIGTMASAQASNNAIQSVAVANQIATNNFQTQVTKEALERADLPQPKLPSLEEQLKTAVKEGIQFNSIATINGAITEFINSTIKATTAWIAGTAAFQTVKAYLDKVKESILAIEVPSGKSLASILQTGKVPK